MAIDGASIPGLAMIAAHPRSDARGSLAKLWPQDGLAIDATWRESFISTSTPGVIRGMHLQLPPHDHHKLVVCISGRILDVVIDLRIGSPAYRQCAWCHLHGAEPNVMFIPAGCAHGFAVAGDEPANVLYLTSTVYAPHAEGGVHWRSVAAPWPTGDRIVSARDERLPPLDDFVSPFAFA
jgi:dTDP-4-dehydrorhamnose 3,5-epimerase